MKRLLVGACAVSLSIVFAVGPTPIEAHDKRNLTMQFDLRTEAPESGCGDKCRTWISATGAIGSETSRDFGQFSGNNDIRGMTLALDSDGGSVLGAIALGRAIRALGMTTTVGRTTDLSIESNNRTARLSPRASCESMCAFVLLAGVERHVPTESSVMVHQIWLGDRRDDAAAARYSAEDLVLVQRDIGRLAQYTVEMGGGIELLEVSLRIPPWEPMRLLSRRELVAMKIVTRAEGPLAEAPVARAPQLPTTGPRVVAGERNWTMAEHEGQPAMVRKHPLTVEGDDIGTFELRFACGSAQEFLISYSESRRSTQPGATPDPVTEVRLSMGGRSIPLQVAGPGSSGRLRDGMIAASARIDADLVGSFSETRARSLMIETVSSTLTTAVRVGNVGFARSFPQFSAGCGGDLLAQGSVPRTQLRREAEAQPRP